MKHKSIFHEFSENDIHQNSTYFEHLSMLKSQIERFQKQQQIRVLEIIHDTKKDMITQNKNGVFINLSNLDLSVIQKIGDYAAYVVKQESELKERESKINEFANTLNETV